MGDRRYLIVGNGVAGISAAEAIRGADAKGAILLVGEEDSPYYYRAAISELIAGRSTEAQLAGRTARFYADMRIEQRDGRVDRVDPGSRAAFLADGTSLHYDELLIATGAAANRLAIPGLDRPLVMRSIADARRIRELAGCCAKVLVVGAGVLGLEAAGALRHAGARDICIVHLLPHIGAPLLDKPAADWLLQRITADGVEVFLEDTVERVEAGRAHLRSGAVRPFDLLIQAVGITPVFPDVPGLTRGQGIRIDERCRTSLPHVHAAGDCTETLETGSGRWQTTRFWLDGSRQGRKAGLDMAGADCRLAVEPFSNASYIYTLPYSFLGRPHGPGGQVHTWCGPAGYRAVRVVDGRLEGALLIGERHGASAVLAAMGRPVAGVVGNPAEPGFPWNDLAAGDWDYRYF